MRDRVNARMDSEPDFRKRINEFGERVSERRNNVSEMVQDQFKDRPNRNFGDGNVVGALMSVVAVALEDVIGVPLGGDVNTKSINEIEGGTEYVFNVNAPTSNIAEAKSVIDASTGYVAYITDSFDVSDAEVQHERIARDTYEVTVRLYN